MNRTLRNAACWTTLAVVALFCWPADAQAEKTVLRLRLDGPIMEAPSDAAGLLAILAEQETHTLHDYLTTLRKAGADSDIDGLALIIESPMMSFAQVEELAAGLQDFRKNGKPVYCYIDAASNLTYALAANTDHITLAENSMLDIAGLRAEIWYYKGMFEKIGVEADMLRCGAYKSFIEPYTRTEPSPEAAENINWLLDGLYDGWVEMIAEGRNLSADKVKALIDEAPLSAEKSLKAKLVDEVSSFPAFKQRMYKEFGKDVTVLKRYEENAGPDIDMENPFALFQVFSQIMQGVTEEREPGIGLIYIEGGIVVGKSDESMFGSVAGSTSIRAAFEQARMDDDIRAVVVRVDSPGGSALASDIIWEAATRCGEEKPLIVSMGGVAGSGGYYVAIPGDEIFADANTITGSIGVGGGKFVLKGLLEDKLGITTAEFQRGKNAGLFSPNKPWTQKDRQWLQDFMDETYDQFKDRIRTSRGDRLKKDLDDIAGGRVFTGRQALEIGLIDRIGGLSDALDYAAKKADLGKDYDIHQVPAPSELAALVNMLNTLSGDDGTDEFEIAVQTQMRQTSWLKALIPLVNELAPAQAGQFRDMLRNVVILQREHIGCYMPIVPEVR